MARGHQLLEWCAGLQCGCQQKFLNCTWYWNNLLLMKKTCFVWSRRFPATDWYVTRVTNCLQSAWSRTASGFCVGRQSTWFASSSLSQPCTIDVHIVTAQCCASATYAVAWCPSVCLSIHLSITSWWSIETDKHVITQTTSHDSWGTLVFWCQTSQWNSSGYCAISDDLDWVTFKVICPLEVFLSSIFLQLCSSWQDFNWHSVSHGPSALAELLVAHCCISLWQVNSCYCVIWAAGRQCLLCLYKRRFFLHDILICIITLQWIVKADDCIMNY